MKVLIVDDDKLVTTSLETILNVQKDIDVVAVGNSGEEGIELYARYHPDIILMDIRMEGMTGIEAATCILKETKTTDILFLTTFFDNEYIVQALKIGAKGYILKQDFESIVPSIYAVRAGQSVFGDKIVDALPELLTRYSSSLEDSGLTERELEILMEIAEGLNNKEISEKIHLSEGTIRNYISTMLEKLGLRDRTQLAIYYLKNR